MILKTIIIYSHFLLLFKTEAFENQKINFKNNFFKDCIYLFDRERETASKRGNTGRGSGRGRSRLTAEEPDVGLDPRTPGSRPEPKAGA